MKDLGIFTPQEIATIEFYNGNASSWSAEHANIQFWAPEIAELNKLSPSGKLLELGSGGGRDAQVLSLTYDYVGVDVSSDLIREAKANNPDLPFFEQSLYQLEFPDNTFDNFWASAVFLHIPKDKIGLALGETHRVSKNGAIGFIAIKEGVGEEVLKDGRYFGYYQVGEFAGILSDCNFKNLYSYRVSKGGTTTWLVYFVEVVKPTLTLGKSGYSEVK